jgi:hypothetical protein
MDKSGMEMELNHLFLLFVSTSSPLGLTRRNFESRRATRETVEIRSRSHGRFDALRVVMVRRRARVPRVREFDACVVDIQTTERFVAEQTFDIRAKCIRGQFVVPTTIINRLGVIVLARAEMVVVQISQMREKR